MVYITYSLTKIFQITEMHRHIYSVCGKQQRGVENGWRSCAFVITQMKLEKFNKNRKKI